jgi:hypothetical protein
VAQNAHTGGPARSIAFYTIQYSSWLATLQSTWADYNADALLSGASAGGFGVALASTTGFAFVGDPEADAGSGAVYVFKLTTGAWAPSAKIAAPAGETGFGKSLAYATQLFVGSDSSTDAVGSNALVGAGAVFVYDTPTATPILAAKVVSPNRQLGALFGTRVAAVDNLSPAERLLAVGESDGNGLNVYRWNSTAVPKRYDSLSFVGPPRYSAALNYPLWTAGIRGGVVLFGGDSGAVDPLASTTNQAEGAVYVLRRTTDF